MNTLLALLTLVCGACVTPTVRHPMPSQGSIAAQRLAAVEVVSVCLSGRIRIHTGSGVVVSPTYILTAAHVVSCSGAEVSLSQPGGPIVRARVEMLDHRIDVARLMVVDGQRLRVSPLRVSRITPRSRICAASAVPEREYHCGMVESFLPRRAGDMSYDMFVEPGNSGSGVYDDRGALVGIVTHHRPGGGLATSIGDKRWVMP